MCCIKLQWCLGLLFQPYILFSLFSSYLKSLTISPSISTLAVVYLKYYLFLIKINRRPCSELMVCFWTFWRPALFKFIYLFNGIFKFIHYIILGVHPWVWLRPKLRNVECRLSYVVEVRDRRGVVWISPLQYKNTNIEACIND